MLGCHYIKNQVFSLSDEGHIDAADNDEKEEQRGGEDYLKDDQKNDQKDDLDDVKDEEKNEAALHNPTSDI